MAAQVFLHPLTALQHSVLAAVAAALGIVLAGTLLVAAAQAVAAMVAFP
jgi:hypothetical protein